MKTIPVSFLVAGMLLPAVCLAQPQESGKPPVAEEKGRPPGPKRPFADVWKETDKDSDGFLSSAEFAVMPRIVNIPEEKRANIFKRLDKDGDGKLSREEISRFGKPHGKPDQPMKRLWELDADKNGGISFDEFKAGELFKKLPPEKQDAVFHRLDTDGDGVITPRDKPEPPFHGPRKEGDHPEKPPEQINRKLDTNCDGALSFEEFRVGPAVKNLTEDQQEERFEMLDRNDDLKISAEDFPAPPPPPKPAE
jgi:Ca2+-binding EF-hand superfamily protein